MTTSCSYNNGVLWVVLITDPEVFGQFTQQRRRDLLPCSQCRDKRFSEVWSLKPKVKRTGWPQFSSVRFGYGSWSLDGSSKKRNWTRNRASLLKLRTRTETDLFLEEPSELKTGTVQIVCASCWVKGFQKAQNLPFSPLNHLMAAAIPWACPPIMANSSKANLRIKITQIGMNGDTFSIKAPKECSKKFAATLEGKTLTRGNVLRILFLFLDDFGVPL